MRRTPLQASIDVLAIGALVLVAIAPLSAAYDDPTFWIAASAGLILGAAVAVAGAVWRWHILTVAALAVIGYFVFGAAAVFRGDALFGFVPTLDVLAALALGIVQVWKQALTVDTPFTGYAALLIAPYLLALVVGAFAVSLALRLRRFAFALVPVGLLLVAAISFSTYQGFAPGIVGAIFAGIALLWTVWRVRAGRAETGARLDDVEKLPAPARSAGLTAVAAVVVVAVIGAGTVAVAAGSERQVLRDHVVPPLELHDYASPLTAFRKYVRDGADATLFTVEGLPAGASIRLATLDDYDGIVYRVSGAGGAGSGTFSRVGREIVNPVVGTPARVTVTVDELTGVWMPTVGYLSSLAYDGRASADHEGAIHYNAASGTAVDTLGVGSGDTYLMDVVVPETPDPQELESAQLAQVSTPPPGRLPDALSAAVDEAVADAETPIQQVMAIESYLQERGFFSHGLEGEVVSRSGHGQSRESELFDSPQMVGDDEQYAVAMALMVAQLGIPVRVVMGFTPESDGGSVSVTGDDLHAWVEVPFEGLGWVAFSPTPSEDKVPQQQVPEQRQKPRVQVAQPPEQPQEPAELPPAPPVEQREQGDQPVDLAWLWAALRVTGTILAVLLILLGPSLLLGALRRRRRRRRSAASTTAGRVGGGWSEFVDAATDVGVPVPPGSTRREQGAVLSERFPEAGAAGLATRADVAVFGHEDPTPDEVAAFWADVDSARTRMARAVPWYRRALAALFPRSVVRNIRARVLQRRSSGAAGSERADA